ncbi:MAG: hypothetical protein V4812_18565 [Pseudomonadota bacterium]
MQMPSYSIIAPILTTTFQSSDWKYFSDNESSEGLTINIGLGDSFSYVVSVDYGFKLTDSGKSLKGHMIEKYKDPSYAELENGCVISSRRDDSSGRSRYYEYDAACLDARNNKIYTIVVSEKNILGREPEKQFETMLHDVVLSFRLR